MAGLFDAEEEMAGEEVESSTDESTQHEQEADQAVQEPNDFDLVDADTSEEVDEDEQDERNKSQALRQWMTLLISAGNTHNLLPLQKQRSVVLG